MKFKIPKVHKPYYGCPIFRTTDGWEMGASNCEENKTVLTSSGALEFSGVSGMSNWRQGNEGWGFSRVGAMDGEFCSLS
eukprot:536325-Amorphochlora_amoeboformis.AAC.1